MIDAKDQSTVFRYDEARQLISETNSDRRTRSLTYYVFGNLETETDYAGKTTRYEYDVLDLVDRHHRPDRPHVTTVSLTRTGRGKRSADG